MATRQTSFSNVEYLQTFRFVDPVYRNQEYAKVGPSTALLLPMESGKKACRVKDTSPVIITLPDPTPEEKAAARVRAMDRYLIGKLDEATETLTKWTARFAANPEDAFLWGDGAVRAAGTLGALKAVQAIFHKSGLDAAVQYATTKALEMGRATSYSTSPMANLLEHYIAAAYAEFASRMREAEE